MNIYIGADHRGFELKNIILKHFSENGYTFIDVGNQKYDENDDYPDFADKAVRKMINDKDSVAIVICGSGVGVDIVANKIKGARSVLGFSVEQVKASRMDDDTNVLSLSADFIDKNMVKDIVDIWLNTEFSNDDRFVRRIKKINKIEIEN